MFGFELRRTLEGTGWGGDRIDERGEGGTEFKSGAMMALQDI
jgi:hypothetical protein